MSLDELHQELGGTLAPDGIPLHYGNQKHEYTSALKKAVLMDRSHEGRLESRGKDRLQLINRISTNDLLLLDEQQGCPTILTNPNGRIIDRLLVYNFGNRAIIFTEPGRGAAVKNYLQRQVFFNDDFLLADLASETRLFTLIGPESENILRLALQLPIPDDGMRGFIAPIAGGEALFFRRKPVAGQQWLIVVPNQYAESIWKALLGAGKPNGLIAAGSLTYNALRIRAGLPAIGRELSLDYIPLEAGLWDEVSFSKGCYTGQEIIARMESRNRLAKTLVKFRLSEFIETPADLRLDGKSVGTLTSSVTTPENEILGLGFVKVPVAIPEQVLTVGDRSIPLHITELAGVPPPLLQKTVT